MAFELKPVAEQKTQKSKRPEKQANRKGNHKIEEHRQIFNKLFTLIYFDQSLTLLLVAEENHFCRQFSEQQMTVVDTKMA